MFGRLNAKVQINHSTVFNLDGSTKIRKFIRLQTLNGTSVYPLYVELFRKWNTEWKCLVNSKRTCLLVSFCFFLVIFQVCHSFFDSLYFPFPLLCISNYLKQHRTFSQSVSVVRQQPIRSFQLCQDVCRGCWAQFCCLAHFLWLWCTFPVSDLKTPSYWWSKTPVLVV